METYYPPTIPQQESAFAHYRDLGFDIVPPHEQGDDGPPPLVEKRSGLERLTQPSSLGGDFVRKEKPTMKRMPPMRDDDDDEDFSPALVPREKPLPLSSFLTTPHLQSSKMRLESDVSRVQIANYNVQPAPILHVGEPLDTNETIHVYLVESSTMVTLNGGFQAGEVKVLRAGQTSVSFAGLKLSKMGPIKSELSCRNSQILECFFQLKVQMGSDFIFSNPFRLVSSCSQMPQDLREIVRPSKKTKKDPKDSSTPSPPPPSSSHMRQDRPLPPHQQQQQLPPPPPLPSSPHQHHHLLHQQQPSPSASSPMSHQKPLSKPIAKTAFKAPEAFKEPPPPLPRSDAPSSYLAQMSATKQLLNTQSFSNISPLPFQRMQQPSFPMRLVQTMPQEFEETEDELRGKLEGAIRVGDAVAAAVAAQELARFQRRGRKSNTTL